MLMISSFFSWKLQRAVNRLFELFERIALLYTCHGKSTGTDVAADAKGKLPFFRGNVGEGILYFFLKYRESLGDLCMDGIQPYIAFIDTAELRINIMVDRVDHDTLALIECAGF